MILTLNVILKTNIFLFKIYINNNVIIYFYLLLLLLLLLFFFLEIIFIIIFFYNFIKNIFIFCFNKNKYYNVIDFFLKIIKYTKYTIMNKLSIFQKVKWNY